MKKLRKLSDKQLFEYFEQIFKEVKRRMLSDKEEQLVELNDAGMPQINLETVYEKSRKVTNKKDIDEILDSEKEQMEYYAKKAQLKREETIERAKRDIDMLKRIAAHGLLSAKSNVEFIINKEKRTVVALLKDKYINHIHRRGIAKCLPDDCFNTYIGKVIALYRALGFEASDEYLNVPNPTKVYIGDIVEYKWLIGDPDIETYTVESINDNEVFYTSGDREEVNGINKIHSDKLCVRVIDDSRDHCN